MNTKRHKHSHKKTRRRRYSRSQTPSPSPSHSLSVKVLKTGYPLYASKSYEGSTILQYNRDQERKYHDKCLMQNSSWFGDLEVAKSYETKETHVYRWTTKKKTNLLKICPENERFIDELFHNTSAHLIPIMGPELEKNIKKINTDNSHPYIKMTPTEKALFEFKFCFGFITLEEQYEFMKFVKYVIEHKITDIKRRDGKSILNKLKLKLDYYQVASVIEFNKKEKMNRISFYDFDKHAIMNLCKIIYNSRLDIAGVYQKNDTSFWFPDLVVYKMNIQEYILFDPQDNLVFDTLVNK